MAAMEPDDERFLDLCHCGLQNCEFDVTLTATCVATWTIIFKLVLNDLNKI